MAESVFRVAGFVKAAVHQFLNSCLRAWALKGRNERIPFGRDVRIGGETGQVDEMLRIAKRLLVKGRNPLRKGVNESIQVGVGQGAIHVAVELREVRAYVIRAHQYFQSAATSD